MSVAFPCNSSANLDTLTHLGPQTAGHHRTRTHRTRKGLRTRPQNIVRGVVAMLFPQLPHHCRAQVGRTNSCFICGGIQTSCNVDKHAKTNTFFECPATRNKDHAGKRCWTKKDLQQSMSHFSASQAWFYRTSGSTRCSSFLILRHQTQRRSRRE